MDKEANSLNNNENMVDLNQEKSAQNEPIGEGEIKTYEEEVPGGKPREDVEEISSTDDV